MKCTNIVCGEEFPLPVYECPNCGDRHKDLRPGSSGLLHSKCKCTYSLPCSTVSGRSKLKAFCPHCGEDLSASNATQFFIQLIGGTSAGKTTYLAAFQHLYLEAVHKSSLVRNISVDPQHRFNDLERMFVNGEEAETTNEPNPYSFLHTFSKKSDYQFSIFDIPGEMVIDGSYKATFRVCHGLVIIIDPASVAKVRELSEKEGEDVSHHSTFNFQKVIEKFISDFKEMRSLKASQRSDIPVAVVITKTDLKNVKRQIGGPKIKIEFSKNKEAYSDNEDIARDRICKCYLDSLGFTNALNAIHSSFSNVKYFPVSAMGPAVRETKSYEPFGVKKPIAWIAQEAKSKIAVFLKDE